MRIPDRLRLGCVKYLNARPLIHGWRGEVRFDHPSALCRQLAAGALDVALVSSFEYLRNPNYTVVDRLAIASDGPVYSVIVAHIGPIERVREVVVDPASETSVNLLHCLFGERGSSVRFVREGELGADRGILLIGDQAIRFRAAASKETQFFDLGLAWKEATGLPFVYALWLVRPDYPGRTEVAAALRAIATANLENLEQVIAEEPKSNRPFCEFYFRQCLRFSFGAEEKEGFQKFAERCAEQKLILTIPPPPDLV